MVVTTCALPSRAKRDSEGTVAAGWPKKVTKIDSCGPKFMSGSKYSMPRWRSAAMMGLTPSRRHTTRAFAKRVRPRRTQVSTPAWRCGV